MKTIYKITFMAVAALFAFSCEQGIDPITPMEPGADEAAPTVTINYPQEGTKIKVNEAVTSINIKFEVEDDIEIASISVNLDGTEISSYNEFKDYRRVQEEYLYEELNDGSHVLTITATDIEGKSTSESVNFEKEPAYVPMYDGEVFYMPFDGDNIELVSITQPTVVGNPGFAGEGIQGGNAYAGAEGSYLTFPTEGLQGSEFSAAFWVKVNATPDRAGVLVMGPEDSANPDNQNVRTSGFRLFRENAGGMQRFKLNVGTGESDSWFDGGAAADVDPSADEWTHIAFTIGASKATVYIDGVVAKEGEFAGVDWTGCDVLSIMSGAPRFTGWGHLSDQSFMDELRIFNKELSAQEIATIIENESGNAVDRSQYGEVFHMPFEGDLTETIGDLNATAVGNPGFAGSGKVGANAYQGAADSYVSVPATSLQSDEFSATFWYKVNATPDRAGILVMGPKDTDNPDAQNKRTSGFRFFREGGETNQIFKLNVGSGEADSWFDGGAAATIDPTANSGWVHMAFTISATQCTVYIDGEVVAQGDFTGVDWTGCDLLSIGSGAPRFTGWGHGADQSQLDDLFIFDKALTQAEVQAIASGN
ncbi:LamG-like jellyroll fold domain-containing protein [Marinoscillum furvescens]|uniref:Concanavalin A-like lectin/glucanase superfamily protein n=1 Tax=Marinoscillum furvescens DSM 4134 TaxID=1122208 RepID=A0A3D9KZV3_MARFU|nr:LamG-like jellyroll fold domain-containing protein [Marinoscillum furvescens]RED96177.1 concanavalin A-like lectin/glucanase superfamily protein [Marinoscillum furvescens DSM 4134]